MVEQINSIAGMSPDQIAEATAEGKLDANLQTKPKRAAEARPAPSADQGARGPRPATPTEGMSAEQITELTVAGNLDTYLAEPNRGRR